MSRSVGLDRKRSLLLGAGVVGTALAAYGLAMAVDPGALTKAFAGVRWEWFVVAALAYAASQLVAGFVWRAGLSAGGLHGVGRGCALSSHWLARGAAELLPAQLGEGVRLAALRRHPATDEGGCARIAGSVGAFKLVDGLGNLVVAGLLTLVVPLPGPAANVRWVLLAVLLAAALSGALAWRLGVERAKAWLPAPARRALRGATDGAALLGDRRRAMRAFALHGASTAARIVSLAALLLAFGLPPGAALLVFALLVMASLIPISPGGLGVREAALVPALVAAYGLGTDNALAFSLSIQAMVLAVSLIGGLVALAYHHRGVRRARRERVAVPAPA